MEFYQKLQKLRKENGMSQEELAERLQVSRQAVSKWENDQGLPETDKLVQISSFFSVSLDYLLKDEQTENQLAPKDNNYYGSREMYITREIAEGYLGEKRSASFKIAFAVSLIIASTIFVCVMNDATMLGLALTMLGVAVGVAILIWQGIMPKKYEEIEKKPLTIDAACAKELKNKSMPMKKTNGFLISGGIFFIILAVIFLIVTNYALNGKYQVGLVVLLLVVSVAVGLLIIANSQLEAWEVLLKNEQHMEEVEKEARYGWISGSIMMLATATFLVCGFVWGLWATAWVVFPIGGILCGVATVIAHGIQKGKTIE